MSTTAPQVPPTDATQAHSRFTFGPRPGIGVGPAGKAVAEDISDLIKAEVALAKAEVAGGVKAKAAGAGAFGAAAVMGWLALQGLLIAGGFALALVVPGWAAALIVSGVLLLGALIAALVGKAKIATPVSLETTRANVEEDVAWAKSHLPKR